jgi:hypothetical protein
MGRAIAVSMATTDPVTVLLQLHEQGNGFPEIDDLVTDGETVYQVTRRCLIQTAQYRVTYMVAEVEIKGDLDCHEQEDGKLYPVRVRVL